MQAEIYGKEIYIKFKINQDLETNYTRVNPN